MVDRVSVVVVLVVVTDGQTMNLPMEYRSDILNPGAMVRWIAEGQWQNCNTHTHIPVPGTVIYIWYI